MPAEAGRLPAGWADPRADGSPGPAGPGGGRAAGRLFIKICGVRDEEAVRAAVAAGADAVGFIFHRPSRRWIEPGRAAALAALLPEAVWRVGVFVDAPPEEVAAVVAGARLTAVQLHGAETPETAALLRRRLGVKVIKALRLASPAELKQGRAWTAAPPDFFLLDAAGPAAVPGGTGRAFDWRWAEGAEDALPAPFLLAGGLTPANVAEALAAVRPAGVDVSTGVEREGRKDPVLIRAFVEAVRRWEAGAGAGRTGAGAGVTGAGVCG